MAGIAGIISKNPGTGKEDLTHSFASMMQKLSFSDTQLNRSVIRKNICFGNTIPVSCKLNGHYQHNEKLGIYAVVDGLVFVGSHERSVLSKKYNIDYNQSDYSLIPFLYHFYKEAFVTHLTGWFNLFIYDEKKKISLLINDRLGFLPLYYYESDSYFIFASKIEAILNSGLLASIKPDAVTIAEHLFFNYPLSDATYIENIHTLSNAECFKVRQNKITRTKYWSISELYGYAPANKDESFRLMNEGLKCALHKVISLNENKINVTLTGGWDSRVVLSYLLPRYKDKLNIYSFGAENADDILIPQQIAVCEGLDYTPYVLDQNYLDHLFMPNALKTIALSNGTRNYKRTHYLYAVQKISGISDVLVTGIFGDEVFKVGRPDGGDVLSKNTIDLLRSDFDIDEAMKKFSVSFILDCLNIDRRKISEAFRTRLEVLKSQMDKFETISQKYYSIRFEYNLRKYFGNEAGSYNDFVFCFSPFIDYDFLKNLARTKYFGIHYSFSAKSFRLKKQSTRLYHDIVHTNYKPLVAYNSARGYSMKDANSLLGNLKILYQKYFINRKNFDAFNTNPADHLFNSFLKAQDLNSEIMNSGANPDLLSLFYWLGAIEKKYDR